MSSIRKRSLEHFRAQRTGTTVPITVPAAVQPIPTTSEVEGDSKKGQIRWRTNMDDVLITTLVDQVLSMGRKVDNAFKSEELAPLITQVREKCDVTVAEKNVRFRLKTLRKEWIELHSLFQISGFGWDENTGRITADASVWDEYTKANPSLSKLRGKVCPYYPELEILFGNDTATRDRAVSGHDIPQMSGIFSIKISFICVNSSMKVMELLEQDLADVFLSITNERFRRAWVYNKLGRVPPDVHR